MKKQEHKDKHTFSQCTLIKLDVQENPTTLSHEVIPCILYFLQISIKELFLIYHISYRHSFFIHQETQQIFQNEGLTISKKHIVTINTNYILKQLNGSSDI